MIGEPRRPAVHILLRSIFLVFASVLAGSTVLTQLAQLLHISFRHYCVASVLLSVSAATIVILTTVRRSRVFPRMRQPREDRHPACGAAAGALSADEMGTHASAVGIDASCTTTPSPLITRSEMRSLGLVLLLSVCGSLLALAIYRPDTDDYTYVPPVVYALEHPDEALSFSVHHIHTHGETLHAYLTSTYELYQASLAFTFGVDYLFVYYCVFPGIVGFLIPLASAFALGVLEDRWDSIGSGTLAIFVLYILIGDTHRTFGNFAFARAQHGKAVFLSIGIPVFIGATLDFLQRARRSSWWLVACTSIAMVGCTASAASILPALGSVLLLAFAYETENMRLVVRRSLGFVSAFLYVGIYILAIWGYATANFGKGALENAGWPDSFAGHAAFYFNGHAPATPFYVLIALGVSVAFGERRGLILAWVAAAAALYLNPVVAPYVIDNVTGRNTYWRLFYILPFPLIGGYALAILSRKWRQTTPALKACASVLAIIIIGLGLRLGVHRGTIFESDDLERVGVPGYKIRPNVLSVATAVVAKARPGVMLAPPDIGGAVCMLSGQFPQLVAGYGGYSTWLSAAGMGEEARIRGDAVICLSGKEADYGSLWALLARHPDIVNLVVRDLVLQRRDVFAELKRQGFRVVGRPEDCAILTRSHS
ncbi:MAG: hypothetical protein HYX75_25160 [Acidobacteria bacterium]|nr:hypothetical protein [Acidobacteriota bacterium]